MSGAGERERWRLAQARKRQREAHDVGVYRVQLDRRRVWRAAVIAWLIKGNRVNADGSVDPADIDAAIEAHGDPTDAELTAHAALLLAERIDDVCGRVIDDVHAALSGAILKL